MKLAVNQAILTTNQCHKGFILKDKLVHKIKIKENSTKTHHQCNRPIIQMVVQNTMHNKNQITSMKCMKILQIKIIEYQQSSNDFIQTILNLNILCNFQHQQKLLKNLF
uniref:Uncharacterized protein n=1 Tax=Oxytricha trifallax TaxID=94289 RepID=A7Y482_OXYTR|nr:hypothetical protein [Sterkiella histriomuscorum]